MHLTILATFTEVSTQNDYSWLLAAAIPLALLAAQKKKIKLGFMKRWLLKIALKKGKGKKGGVGKFLLG